MGEIIRLVLYPLCVVLGMLAAKWIFLRKDEPVPRGIVVEYRDLSDEQKDSINSMAVSSVEVPVEAPFNDDLDDVSKKNPEYTDDYYRNQ